MPPFYARRSTETPFRLGVGGRATGVLVDDPHRPTGGSSADSVDATRRGDPRTGCQDRDALAVYFAACFARRIELCHYAEELRANGFVMTSRWLDGSKKLGARELGGVGRGAELARMDFEDLGRADICVAFTEPRTGEERGRGGRHTELGIALALEHRVMLVGPREHVFHCLPEVSQHADWPSALRCLLDDASLGNLAA